MITREQIDNLFFTSNDFIWFDDLIPELIEEANLYMSDLIFHSTRITLKTGCISNEQRADFSNSISKSDMSLLLYAHENIIVDPRTYVSEELQDKLLAKYDKDPGPKPV